ncbi:MULTISPECIES: hypothetical protein [Bacillus]|uniref:hypothetical protein n=1 Tax=Bacillus TaxID=1386 RepID=UPI0005E98133|nr:MULTISPECIES: hypothetical protein [Bacillus]COC33716.1 Uncharacterised protein [Streptococcus pneumoniae]MDK4205073.1 hypothetical protein [Bacillus velezensis]PWK04275.1 hypothetical protein C7819_101336 [Bacillus sp. VMFN-A1]UOF69088.1 hypothetical protein MTX90_05640 [Bacillus velezensis]USK17948.1 hypothetical protein LIT36_05980 [Bacillus velezensis]
MQDLIIEYKRALRETRKMYRLYKDTAEVNLTAEQINDKKMISSSVILNSLLNGCRTEDSPAPAEVLTEETHIKGRFLLILA